MHRTCIAKLAHNMLMLSERDVRQCLGLTECLEVNRKALIALADGTAQVPTRLGIPYRGGSGSPSSDDDSSSPTPTTNESPDHHGSTSHHHDHSHGHSHDHSHHHPPNQSSGSASAAPNTGDSTRADDWTLFKPAAYSNSILGMKIVSIRSDNPTKRNLPLVPATVVSVDAETGVVDAIVAGTYLTAARTAAGSALATAHALAGSFSNPHGALRHLVVFGAGLQAELHVQMIATALSAHAAGDNGDESATSVKKIPMVTIVNRSVERAQALAHKLGDWCDEARAVALSDEYGVADALASSSVIVTATNAVAPLFTSPSLIPPGCHINGIGSYTPTMQEVPSRLVSDRCVVWMDTAEARHVGDLQSLTPHHPAFLLGSVLADASSSSSGADGSRPHHLDCTFYKAVGTAIQDVMTADLVVRRARQLNLGTTVDMS
jgi:ornithine cyclodeaminase